MDQWFIVDYKEKKFLEFNPLKAKYPYNYLISACYIVSFLCFIGSIVYGIWFSIWDIESWLIFTFIVELGLGCSSFIYMMAKGYEERRDEGWFDAWTPSHLGLKILLFLFFMYLGIGYWYSFLSVMIFAILWEIFEWKIMEKIWYNFGGEDSANHLSDIVVAIISCILGYLIYTFLII
jgi:hypothetical protein